jgi:quinol monooxygenase YgiN
MENETPAQPDLFTRLSEAGLKNRPFTLLVTFDIQLEKLQGFLEVAQATALATLQEAGCIAYEFHTNPESPGIVILFEKWQNAPALEAHMQLPHTVELLSFAAQHSACPLKLEFFKQLPIT